MGEPTNPPTGVFLEVRTLGIQDIEVSFLLLDVGDSAGRGRASRTGLHRGPAVLGEDDLLAIDLGVDPIQIIVDEAPGSASGSGGGTEERQHVESDEVNGIQNGLSATIGPETICHFGDGDEDTEGTNNPLGRLDLGCKGVGRQDVIEQGLRTELNGSGDELGLGVAFESCEKTVPAGLPDVVTVKPELSRARDR